MSFNLGFEKVSGTMEGIASGVKAAGKEAVKDMLSLKGLRDAVHGTKDAYKGRMKSLFNTSEGREHLADAVGKSLPSLAAGTLYGKALHKSYKKMTSQSQNSYDEGYPGYR